MSRSETDWNEWSEESNDSGVGSNPGRPVRATAMTGGGLVLLILVVGGLAWVARDSANRPAEEPSTRGRFQHQVSPLETVAFAPDGRILATGHINGTLQIQDLSRGPGRPREFEEGLGESVRAVAFSPDGKTLASGGVAAALKLWDVESGTLRTTLEGHESPIGALSFSPDGKTLASGSLEGRVKVQDVETGQELASLPATPGTSEGWPSRPDGKLLASGGFDGIVRVWDVATGRERTAVRYKGRRIYSLAFAPNGRGLVFGLGGSTSGLKGQVILWNLAGGREAIRILGEASFASVAFSPNGQIVAAGGGDRVVKLWDVETGREFPSLEGHEGFIASLAFSPDGQLLATGGQDSLVGLFLIRLESMKAAPHRL